MLLDVDGTLLDFAPTPEAVIVPARLLASLRRIKPTLGDALGVISGRAIEQVDGLLSDTPYAVAGEHGGAIRHAPGAAIERPGLPALPDDWVRSAEREAAKYSGARVETKAHGFVLHYRAAPEAREAARASMSQLIAAAPRFELLDGNMAWEIRPRGVDKGSALVALMSRGPFAGRLPLFIGDDVTDHDAIRAARAMGGVGLLVADAFGGPENVRAWLDQVAERGGW